jgi:hypothetical protein
VGDLVTLAAVERERILGELGDRRAMLTYVSTHSLVECVLWRDIADLLRDTP